MINVEIIQDIKSYDPKFIGPLSFRNFICGLIAILLGGGAFLLARIIFVDKFAALIGALFAAPAFLCGYYKPYDIPFEKFIIRYIRNTFLTPVFRKYKITNTFEEDLNVFIKKDNIKEAELKKEQAEENDEPIISKRKLEKMKKKEQEKVRKEIKEMGPSYQALK